MKTALLILATLGFPAAAGMAYGIIRWIRELSWIALGYAVLSARLPKVLDRSRSAAAPSAVEAA